VDCAFKLIRRDLLDEVVLTSTGALFSTELLIACRTELLRVGTREASALVAHIDALLDLDDEASPGSQR